MFQIDGYILLRSTQVLNRLVGALQGTIFYHSVDRHKIGGEFQKLSGEINQLIEILKGIDVPLSLVSAEKLRIQLFENNELTTNDFVSRVEELSSRLSDELGNKLLVVISTQSLRYLKVNKPPYDESMIKEFPEIEVELIEATTCLAYEVPTAAVFHLMRAMEIAVRNLGTLLGISNIEISWGKLLSSIESEIKKMPDGTKKDNWSENKSLLYHVKQAWRNTTMHPKKSYSLIESTQIYDAVQSYLNNLARLKRDAV
jgi:hypothetical protein